MRRIANKTVVLCKLCVRVYFVQVNKNRIGFAEDFVVGDFTLLAFESSVMYCKTLVYLKIIMLHGVYV
jgi:hypothetical protein